MAQGWREETRQMLLTQRWAISTLFGEAEESESQLAKFVRTGKPPSQERDRARNRELIDARRKEIRTGKRKLFQKGDE